MNLLLRSGDAEQNLGPPKRLGPPKYGTLKGYLMILMTK